MSSFTVGNIRTKMFKVPELMRDLITELCYTEIRLWGNKCLPGNKMAEPSNHMIQCNLSLLWYVAAIKIRTIMSNTFMQNYHFFFYHWLFTFVMEITYILLSFRFQILLWITSKWSKRLVRIKVLLFKSETYRGLGDRTIKTEPLSDSLC